MPLVSVILPTYNRSRFLPDAFASIEQQTLQDWELILVDDGSTDDTASVVGEWQSRIPQPVKFFRQENRGAYGARNMGLDHAEGELVAFFDSDDLWLPHHLADCAKALRDNADVDWVYGSCRILDYQSGQVLAPDTFLTDGAPRPFKRLPAEARGPLHVLPQRGLVECALLQGLHCGLQNSVLRRNIFVTARFEAALRNEAEDQLFVIRAIKHGHRIGYLDNVHVQYHVHDSNSSGSATGPVSLDRQRRLLEPLVRGFEHFREECALTPSELVALKRRLHRECFWHLGYSVFKARGMYGDALSWFRRGLREWPWSARAWKTYAVTTVQALMR